MNNQYERDMKPADHRRPRAEDGVITRLKWYAWVAYEYAKTFSIGTVAVLVALFVGGAAGRLLVPGYMTRPEFGWILAAWMLSVIGLFVIWARARMARTGIETAD